ncbi:threonine ammonia-lyase, biosynthetic [Frateuria aurantia]
MSELSTRLHHHLEHAQVYEAARVTALEPIPLLGARLGQPVWLKREDTQAVFSFKLRGAYNKMAQLDETQRQRGVIAASAGNHAQGVALAAARLGIRAVIVMPVTAPQVKVDAVHRFGGDLVEVVLSGDSYSDAQLAAERLRQERGLTFVHPFDDLDVIAGQATVGLELLEQHPGPLHAVFVPVGGGGLLAGVAATIKRHRPDVKIIGVQTVDSDAMVRSLEAGHPVSMADVGLFSDGTAVKRVGDLTFALCQEHVDAMIRVDTDEVCAAIKDMYEDTRSIPEPAGALALAGLKQYAAGLSTPGAPLIAICSGANLNFDRLRFVAERAELGEQREAIYVVTIPERRGSLQRFCRLLGDHAITEFNYRIADAGEARVFVGIRTSQGGRQGLLQTFREAGYPTLDLSADELAKLHLRHLVGGRAPLAQDEWLYRFEFPERPGALGRFLEHMHPHWNISLFHYRNHGADYGRVLIGLQVPAEERPLFQAFLEQLGYPWSDESHHAAYRELLRCD